MREERETKLIGQIESVGACTLADGGRQIELPPAGGCAVLEKRNVERVDKVGVLKRRALGLQMIR